MLSIVVKIYYTILAIVIWCSTCYCDKIYTLYIAIHSIFGGEQGAEEGAVYREEGGAVAMLSQSFDFATSMFLLLFYLALQVFFQCYN